MLADFGGVGLSLWAWVGGEVSCKSTKGILQYYKMAEKTASLYSRLARLTYIHFIYMLLFAVSIIIYDASQLIAPEAVLYRWKLATTMIIVITAVWYFARVKARPRLQRWLIATLVFADILFASFLVYADRGMASLAVTLYAVPIIVSAATGSSRAILGTASLCTAAYTLATVKYFVDYFNEGYKVQLYSTIGFYGAVFFLIAFLITINLHTKADA